MLRDESSHELQSGEHAEPKRSIKSNTPKIPRKKEFEKKSILDGEAGFQKKATPNKISSLTKTPSPPTSLASAISSHETQPETSELLNEIYPSINKTSTPKLVPRASELLNEVSPIENKPINKTSSPKSVPRASELLNEVSPIENKLITKIPSPPTSLTNVISSNETRPGTSELLNEISPPEKKPITKKTSLEQESESEISELISLQSIEVKQKDLPENKSYEQSNWSQACIDLPVLDSLEFETLENSLASDDIQHLIDDMELNVSMPRSDESCSFRSLILTESDEPTEQASSILNAKKYEPIGQEEAIDFLSSDSDEQKEQSQKVKFLIF